MATTHGAKRVVCTRCPWRGQRVPRDPMDPNHGSDVSGFGLCPSCNGRLVRQTTHLDKAAAKAKAELLALNGGARV